MDQGGVREQLALRHAFVVVVSSEGRIEFVSPEPVIPGLWLVESPVGLTLREATRPAFVAALEQVLSGAQSETVLPLEAPHRLLSVWRQMEDDPIVLCGEFRSLHDPLRMPIGEGDTRTLRRILLHSRQGVLLQGPKAEILMANQAALDLLGLTEAQLLGATSYDPRWRVVDAEGREFPVERLPVPLAIATKQPVRDVTAGVFRPTQGDWVWLNLDAFPQLRPDGSIESVVCAFTDVTARRRAEEGLRREHALYTQVMETSIAGFCLLDPQGHITFANPAAEQILGLSRAELVGRTYDQPEWRATDVDGRPWPDERQPFVRVISTGEPVMNVRHGIEWPNGDRKLLSVNGAPIKNDAGEIISCVFAIADITEETLAAHERERLQQEMTNLSRLESMSVLASGVAHDLNNILVGVRAATESLVEQFREQQLVAEELSLLTDSVARVKELTSQLLAYSGKGQFVVGPADLSQEVRDTAQLLDSLRDKNTVLSMALGDELPRADIDRTQVRQVLMNLVLNASEAFDGQPGEIEIRTSFAHRGTGSDQKRFVVLEVSDNGPGMTESVRRRVFDPFFTTKKAGNGLGLAAVQGIMRGHGGFVEVESEKGRGTTFRLSFPAAGLVEASPSSAPPSSEVRHPLDGTVLVIDDEPVVQRSLQRMLSQEPCDVLVAADGVAGLEMLDRHPEVTIVLLDLTMPRMRGDAVLEQIRRERPELPVVVMSGYSESAISTNSVGTSFIQKPFGRLELLSCIDALVSSLP